MKPRIVYRSTPALPVDEKLFARIEEAANCVLCTEHRNTLSALIQDFNELPIKQAEYRRQHGLRRPIGRGLSVNQNAFVGGVLMVLQDAGVRITAYRHRENPKIDRGGSEMAGSAAAALRVVWDALEDPRILREGFARLAIRSWREPRARARKTREAYRERTSNAWRH